jgi:DNA invertase Pin-like site-specific DNA recombinase
VQYTVLSVAGLKGTMSEFELNLLRQRSLEAIRQKARRGELQFRLQRSRPANKLRPPRPALGSIRDFMCALSESIAWLRSKLSHEM